MDINKLLGGLAKSGILSNAAAGAAGGLLGAMVSGKGGKSLGPLLKGGALVAVGGLALQAWQQYQKAQQPENVATNQTPAATPRIPASTPVQTASPGSAVRVPQVLLVRTMVAAAMADGHIDRDETTRIFDAIGKLDLDADDKALILGELRQPASIDELASGLSDLNARAEVYAAAMLAIDRSCQAGQMWLGQLAAKLEMPVMMVEEMERRLTT